jgi:hypothetical protein
MKKVKLMMMMTLIMCLLSCNNNKTNTTDVKSGTVDTVDVKNGVVDTVDVKSMWSFNIVSDEFGDPTGDTVKVKLFDGEFSNSATNKSELIVKVIDYNTSIVIQLYEYKSKLANISYEHSFGSMNVKNVNGSIVKYKVFFMKGTGLYFDEDSDFYKDFRSPINKEFKIFINTDSFDSNSGTSKYNFKIIK